MDACIKMHAKPVTIPAGRTNYQPRTITRHKREGLGKYGVYPLAPCFGGVLFLYHKTEVLLIAKSYCPKNGACVWNHRDECGRDFCARLSCPELTPSEDQEKSRARPPDGGGS